MLMQLNWMHANANWMHSVKLYMHLFKSNLHALNLYMHAVKLYLHAFHLYGLSLRITTLGETHIRSLSTQGSRCSQVYADRRCRRGGQVGDKRSITLEEATHADCNQGRDEPQKCMVLTEKGNAKEQNILILYIMHFLYTPSNMHCIWINLCTL